MELVHPAKCLPLAVPGLCWNAQCGGPHNVARGSSIENDCRLNYFDRERMQCFRSAVKC